MLESQLTDDAGEAGPPMIHPPHDSLTTSAVANLGVLGTQRADTSECASLPL